MVEHISLNRLVAEAGRSGELEGEKLLAACRWGQRSTCDRDALDEGVDHGLWAAQGDGGGRGYALERSAALNGGCWSRGVGVEGRSQQLRRARRQPECRGGQLLVQSTLNGKGGGKYWGLAELVEPSRGGHNTLPPSSLSLSLWVLR